jgi:hypothetical protein
MNAECISFGVRSAHMLSEHTTIHLAPLNKCSSFRLVKAVPSSLDIPPDYKLEAVSFRSLDDHPFMRLDQLAKCPSGSKAGRTGYTRQNRRIGKFASFFDVERKGAAREATHIRCTFQKWSA